MGVFDDATVRNICGAFDLACKQLKAAGSRMWFTKSYQRTIAAARRGERDVKLLQDAGLIDLRKPNHQIVGEGDSDERGDSPNSPLNTRSSGTQSGSLIN
jgi:hypothetical protein